MSKKAFSSFADESAFKALALEPLLAWDLKHEAIALTPFFTERLARLQQRFDLQRCEESKKLSAQNKSGIGQRLKPSATLVLDYVCQ